MDFEISQSRILYSLGGLLGVLAILYFGQQLILDLSPTVKSFILLSVTAAFLGAGEYTGDGVLSSSLYVFSAFSYLSFLAYTITRFGFRSNEIFLILAASSALFIGLGYFRSERDYELENEKARKVVLAVVALVAFAVVFDVVGAQPEYSLELKENVDIVENKEFKVGELEIRNDFLLSRNVDVPTFMGCISGTERRNIYIRPDTGDIISGGEVERIELTDTVRSRPDENVSISGNYEVVREECPQEPEEGTLYISENDGREVVVGRE